MANLHMFESVGSAGIGRENPKGLGAVATIHLPAAPQPFIRADPDQSTAIDGFSEDFLAILRGSNRPALTINHIASDLNCGHPTEHVSESWPHGGRFGRIDLHETGNGSKIRDDGDDLTRKAQLVELQRNSLAWTGSPSNNLHNAALHPGAPGYF